MNLRNYFVFLLMLCFMTSVACVPEQTQFDDNANSEYVPDDGNEDDKPDEPNPDDPKPDPGYQLTEDDKKINLQLFDIINLDYPGLQTVKEEYSQKHYANAANALMDYFRNRTNVTNPELNLTTDFLYTEQQSIADQALEHRFAVKASNWYESVNGSSYTYWDFDDANGKINWGFEPEGAGTEYYQKHWHAWFTYLGRAYNIKREEKYFNSWKEVYSDWLENFPCPDNISAYGNRSWHQLSVATRIASQLELFEYFKSSPNFTGEWLSIFLVEFYKAVQFSRKNPYYSETSNIRFAQQTAQAKTGILFPEFKEADAWLRESGNDFSNQINDQFYSDGVYFELAFNYQLGVMDNYRSTYVLANANNRLDAFSSDFNKKLRNAAKFMMNIIWPDYTWECFNDTFAQTKSVLLRNMRNYSQMFPDDAELKWSGTDGAEGTKPTSTVISFPDGGYHVLRTGWDTKSTMLILKNNWNPGNQWHANMDNGTIALWSKGRNFMPDAGVYTYGGENGLDNARKEFQKTCNHNTLTRNLANIPENHSKGKCLLTQSQAKADVVVTENPSYADLTHRRAIYLVDKTFYVIVDEAYGNAAGVTLNLSFHLCEDTAGGKGANVVKIDDSSSSYVYGAHTEFADGNNMTYRTFSETTEGYKAENGLSDYSLKLDTKVARKYYRVNVNKKSASDVVRFITVIHPSSDASVAAEFKTAYDSKSSSVKVTVNGTSYDLSYSL